LGRETEPVDQESAEFGQTLDERPVLQSIAAYAAYAAYNDNETENGYSDVQEGTVCAMTDAAYHALVRPTRSSLYRTKNPCVTT
jgi:hypothetical protein